MLKMSVIQPETICVNEYGRRIDDSHPRTKVPRREVERMRDLHEKGASTAELAAMFHISEQQVRNICAHRSRNQIMVTERKAVTHKGPK